MIQPVRTEDGGKSEFTETNGKAMKTLGRGIVSEGVSWWFGFTGHLLIHPDSAILTTRLSPRQESQEPTVTFMFVWVSVLLHLVLWMFSLYNIVCLSTLKEGLLPS